jgi:hypothetical protein
LSEERAQVLLQAIVDAGYRLENRYRLDLAA